MRLSKPSYRYECKHGDYSVIQLEHDELPRDNIICDTEGCSNTAYLVDSREHRNLVREPRGVQEHKVEPVVTALDEQVGGTHYKECAIQPIQYIEANELGFLEGCVVKRLTRHNKPTGKGKQDIEKAIHELQLLLQLRYTE